MSETILLTESPELAHKEGIVSRNDAGYLKSATLGKWPPDVLQFNTERQSTILEGSCIDKKFRESSEEVGSSVTNNIIDSRDDLDNLPILGVATETRTGLLQSPTSGKFFQNTHFKIQRSTIAGLGAIAARNLTEGDVILRCGDEPSCECTAEAWDATDTSDMENKLLCGHRNGCRLISSGVSVQPYMPPVSEH
ncbi:hypothetical protein E4U42_006771 [Claviceps africana]|uniref:Uncharacterized protein n=1 Tax=Claviceps africana TaxID=83212 RepID=A0A8K0JDT4_9HYPO|nr:hypothetical protein E4U42_006771 [Claviceps africana]